MLGQMREDKKTMYFVSAHLQYLFYFFIFKTKTEYMFRYKFIGNNKQRKWNIPVLRTQNTLKLFEKKPKLAP